MKSARKMLMLAAALFIFKSGAVHAQSDLQFKIYGLDTKNATLKIENKKKSEPVSVALKDAQGNILYHDKAYKNQYTKKFDFSKAEDGTYVFDIIQQDDLMRNILIKQGADLKVMDDKYVFQKDVDLKDNGKKMVVKFDNYLNEPATVRIMDNDGHVLYEETDIRSERFAKLFNLSKLNEGVYTMSLSTDSYTSYNRIQL